MSALKTITSLSLGLTLTFLLSACNEQKAKTAPKAPPPLDVQSVTVQKKNFPIWLQYTGMTKATSDLEIRARVQGRLQKVYFHDGDVVTEGQTLFKIEQTQYIANLNQAKSKKTKDIASLKLAKTDVARYIPLVKDGLAPRATLEQYEAKEQELEAQILSDNADIANAELELSYTMVKAPVSGKVSARRVDKGNLVGYGESTLLTTITQISSIYAYFSPSESDVQKIYKFRSQKKLPAFIEVRGSGENILKRKRLNGVVDFTNNTVDPLTSTISMRATIDNHDLSVYPGTFVYINIFITDKFKFIMVPPQAVQEDQLGKFVYTIDKDKKAKKSYIESSLSTRYYTTIRTGLKDGDKVIINGMMKLRAGRVVNAKDMTETLGVDAILEKNNLIPEAVK